jgi:hypothetical protein
MRSAPLNQSRCSFSYECRTSTRWTRSLQLPQHCLSTGSSNRSRSAEVAHADADLPWRSSPSTLRTADGGLWVLVQNWHLARSWMPRFNQIIASMHPQKIHPRFRLCLVTISSIDFPIPIMHQRQTLIYEIPMGMRDNSMRLCHGFDPEDYRQIDQLSQERASLFRLELLHAVILERLQFRALAWNVPYECNPSDFIISMRHL